MMLRYTLSTVPYVAVGFILGNWMRTSLPGYLAEPVKSLMFIALIFLVATMFAFGKVLSRSTAAEGGV